MPKSNAGAPSVTVFVIGLVLVYAGIVSLGIGLYYRYLPAALLGLALVAIGLALYSAASARASFRQMRAMANLVFHEKAAIILSYLGKRREQIDHDRQATGEFERWVEPGLKKEFERLWQQFFESNTRPIVVKIGGSTLGSHDTTLRDLIALQQKGVLPVVVHGGGNEITSWLKKMNVSTTFVRGMRVTDRETLRVVIAVLAGVVNKELVAAINSLGGKAIGLSGVDGALIEAKVENPELGYVGEVTKVNPELVVAMLSAGYMPVIAPGAFKAASGDNDPVMMLNVNGDVSASEIAVALKAERLIFLTDVPGVQDKDGRLLPRLSTAEARSLIEAGVIKGGMIPKVEACLRALSSVPSAQIVDGRAGGALLAAVDGNGAGTTIA